MAQFCDDCGVSLDLHDGEDSCDQAEERADSIDRLTRLFFMGVTSDGSVLPGLS